MAVMHGTIYSDSLKRTVPITIILPSDKVDQDGRRMNKAPYKSLYLLHGIFGDQTDWLYGTRIARWAMDHDIAVIMPAGENHFYLNQPGAGFDYQNFIGSELVELTREMFPLSKHREDTYIGGLSMGGFGALNNGLKNPETFGGIIALSSASLSTNQFPDSDDSDNILGMKSFTEACSGFKKSDLELEENQLETYIRKNAQNNNCPRMYLACGTDDFLISGNHQLRDLFIENGYDVTYDEIPGGHDWTFWDRQIEKAIEWISPSVQAGLSSGNVGKK